MPEPTAPLAPLQNRGPLPYYVAVGGYFYVEPGLLPGRDYLARVRQVGRLGSAVETIGEPVPAGTPYDGAAAPGTVGDLIRMTRPWPTGLLAVEFYRGDEQTPVARRTVLNDPALVCCAAVNGLAVDLYALSLMLQCQCSEADVADVYDALKRECACVERRGSRKKGCRGCR